MRSMLDQVGKVLNYCSENYYLQSPYCKYIEFLGISEVGEVDNDAPEGEKDLPCVVLYLKQALPPTIVLPREYEGIRIYSLLLKSE